MRRAPLWDGVGSAVAGAFRLAARVRHATKPLHPRGALVTGTVHRTGSPRPSGVPWLDGTGTDQALVRLSRAVGLPPPWPDVHGMAIRVTVDGRPADLLLATTGLGRVSRFLLVPGVRGDTRPYGTLMPYRGSHGPLLLAARALGGDSFSLLWAPLTGSWTTFGTLDLSGTSGPDPDISFDPMLHELPGLDTYDWVRRIREPAYAAARRETSRPTPGAGDKQ